MRGSASAVSGVPTAGRTASIEIDPRSRQPITEPPVPKPLAIRDKPSDTVALTILAALTALVTWNRLTFDAWLTRLDLFTFFLPWYTYLGERLQAFDVPGWNPHLLSGTPFAGDPESGWMYLPAMLAFALISTPL